MYNKNLNINSFNEDLHFFIIWSNGRDKEKQIIEYIDSHFQIINVFEILWSKEKYYENFNRLYNRLAENKPWLDKLEIIGVDPFLLIIVKDNNPNIGFSSSLSGDIIKCNLGIAKSKNELRNLCESNVIHSSSNSEEFLHNTLLILHMDHFHKINENGTWDRTITKLSRDLAGAHGWSSFSELFSYLNIICSWVILRNHEFLPDNFWGNDKDVDLLCRNLSFFSSAACAYKRAKGESAWKVMIEGEYVPFDIRYVGDKYYDNLWETNMLASATINENGVPVLSKSDYFFSLLYHAKLQKDFIKKDYVDRLLMLGQEIGLIHLCEEDMLDDKISAKIINGYLNASGYFFTFSPYIKYNEKVLEYIQRIEVCYNPEHRFEKTYSIPQKIIKKFIFISPSFFFRILPEKLKLRIRKILGI